ncbi:MAG: T9SS type A sorting domain-containing protein, partial [Taibaiella sp.]|nr:T9SS type A sorting domain-containing protein [Taibaiella sp.]
ANNLNIIEVQTADLDGDGKQDVFATAFDAATFATFQVSVFHNTSSGTGSISFGTHVDLSGVTFPPSGITSGDFDADGKLDLAVASPYVTNLYIFRNTSSAGSLNTGSFASPVAYASGTYSIGITVADMDGDKKMDILVGNSDPTSATTSSISIYRNYPLPFVDTIGGPTNICLGSSDTMTNSVTGGTWSVTNPTVASINPTTGVVTPATVGLDTIIYTVICQGDTNSIRKPIVVSAAPSLAVTTGPTTSLCAGDSTTLTNLTVGGTWSTSNASIATVRGTGPLTSSVKGLSAGFAVISYSVSTACATAIDTFGVRVNASAGVISGITRQCIGTSTTLSSTASGGTWTSSTPSIASVTTSGGVVRGNSVGTVTITYTMTGGCFATTRDSVFSGTTVAATTGPSAVCAGATINLSNSTPGGTWSSSAPSVASVNNVGTVFGLTAGSATISYSVTGSCGVGAATYAVTVNAAAPTITGTFTICSGTTTTLGPTSGGTWTSSDGSVAAVGSSTGVVTGGSSTGTATITLTTSSGCYSTQVITVNPLPAPISGSGSVCLGATTTLTDATTPGTWASSAPGVASIGASSGVATGVSTGTVTITYTSTAFSCSVTRSFTVNPNPPAIGGPTAVCSGSTITLTNAMSPGTWSTTSAAIASVTSASSSTGTVTGGTAGTTTITYSLTATGCFATTSITVNPRPAAIGGATSVCMGATDSLYDATPSGTWSVTPATVASISTSGVLTPVSAPGTATVRYTLPTGCFITLAVTTNSLPAAITGPSQVCPYFTITLANATSGGTWASTDTSLAIVSASTGQVTGRVAGIDTIIYRLTSTGCSARFPVTVHPAPMAITGPSSVCRGFTVTLTDSTSGGVWSSNAPTIASINASTGVVYGVSAGSATISYVTSTFNCAALLPFTVNPILTPAVSISMSTTSTVCAGTVVTYTANPTNGGTSPSYEWRVNGAVTGSGPTLSYMPNNGDLVRVRLRSNATCAIPDSGVNTVTMTVNPLLTPSVNITTGVGDTVCVGSAITFSPNGVNGGTAPVYKWKVNHVNVWTGPTWNYFPADSDIIEVVLLSNVTCRVSDTAKDTLLITVSPYLTPSVTISGSDTACGGYPNVFTANPVNGGVAPVYTWYKRNGSTGVTPIIVGGTSRYFSGILAQGDTISVKLTSNFPCVTTNVANSIYHFITVVPVDTPVVDLFVLPGYILSAGSTAWFGTTVTHGGAAPTYRWFRNGVLISGATASTYHTNVINNRDSFTVRVTNHDFCNGITVFDYQRIFIGDNVGVAEVGLDNADIAVIPNPNTGTFTIKGDLAAITDETVDVEITNMLGQVVYRNKLQASAGKLEERITLDANAANGMYMLNVHSENISKVIRFAVDR